MPIYKDLLRGGFWPVYNEYSKSENAQDWKGVTESEGFKFLFCKYESVLNKFNKVPPQLVHNLVKQLTIPFMAEFVETTDNKDFLEVAPDFFSYMFWGSRIYVSYEDFNELVEYGFTDIENIDLDDFDIPIGKSFNLWYRNSKDTEEDVPKFTHLVTGLIMERPDWREAFVYCSWDGLPDNSRFPDWYRAAYRILIESQSISLLCSLCTKRMELFDANDSQSSFNSVLSSIYNNTPFLSLGLKTSATEKIFISPTEFKDFQTAIHLGWDRMLAELGRVANTNPKLERLTTGENYKDIVAVANRQRLTLNQLKLFGIKAKEKWNIELNFAINGIPERQKMEGDVESASMESAPIGTF